MQEQLHPSGALCSYSPWGPWGTGPQSEREHLLPSLPRVLFTDLLPWTEVEVDFFFFILILKAKVAR